MDLSSKFYHDECINCPDLKNLDQYGGVLKQQFPDFSVRSSRLNNRESRFDMENNPNFLQKLLGKKLGITVNAKLQNGNLLLNYSNGNFMGKMIMLILSPIVGAGGIICVIMSIVHLLTLSVKKAMGQSIAGDIISSVLLVLLGAALFIIVIGNIIGFVKQFKLAKKISMKSKEALERGQFDRTVSANGETDTEAEEDLPEEQNENEREGLSAQEHISVSFNMGKNYLKRAMIFLEDGMPDKADEYCEKALDYDPECPEAYLYKLMAEFGIKNKEEIAAFAKKNDLSKSINFKRFVKYASEDQLMIFVQTGKCPKCGKTVDTNMHFCAFCGQPLEW